MKKGKFTRDIEVLLIRKSETYKKKAFAEAIIAYFEDILLLKRRK